MHIYLQINPPVDDKKGIGVKKKWSHAERITRMSVDRINLIVLMQIMEDPAT